MTVPVHFAHPQTTRLQHRHTLAKRLKATMTDGEIRCVQQRAQCQKESRDNVRVFHGFGGALE